MKKPTPSSPHGWKFAGRAGDFHVWHAGKNDYRITDGAAGEQVHDASQFGLAHAKARRLDDTRKAEHITLHYTDRSNGAHAAKAP